MCGRWWCVCVCVCGVVALIYRYERWALRVAGTCEIQVDGVENIDISPIITSHNDYRTKMKEILEKCKFDSI